MPKIHELIPVEADRVAAAKLLTDEAINTFSKKPDHFQGHVRKVEMFDVERQQENTTDIKELVETVDGKLDHVWESYAKALDVAMAKENSNTSDEARANVDIDGKTILLNMPATALLALEKRLGALRDLYQAIPTLDPAYAWEPDLGAELAGTMRTRHPQESYKTEKSLRHKVLYEATKEHPAQIEKYTIDQNVAKVTIDRQSGMVSPATKARWLANITALQTAVKEARQRANMAEVLPLPVAAALRDFIHA